MHEVSLIIATLGERKDDLRALLTSLVPQAEHICEVILVDQHPDPNHVPGLTSEFKRHLPICVTRSARGLSRARNKGLALVTGALVAFPDDDCLYPDGLLQWVVQWFESNTEYGILAVGANDAFGAQSGNRWPQDHCDIYPINAFRTTFSPSLFLRTSVALHQQFDVRLGVGSGTRFGSGEETDYILRLIRSGMRARFNRSRHIIHPRRDMLSGDISVSRAESYGFGMGHLLRMHTLRILWLSFVAYDLVRAGLALCRRRLDGARLCIAHANGLWRGYSSPIEDIS